MPDNAVPLILLTRPFAASDRFAACCAAQFRDAAEIVITPLQWIEPLGPLPDLRGAGALIFTSENGVAVFAKASPVRDLPVFCVGDRTADAAKAVGFCAQSAAGTAENLVALVQAARPAGPIVHLHGRHTRGNVAARLTEASFPTTGAAIYDQVSVAPGPEFQAALASDRRIIIPLFSPRSAALFVQALDDQRPTDLVIPCLSVAVMAELPPPLRPMSEITNAPTATAMLAAITRHISP